MLPESFLKKVAIIGSGPAALMAAEVISGAGHAVSIFEKRKGPARKLLIAGSSGLNITNNLPMAEFLRHYTGPVDLWKRVLSTFSPQHWIRFIEDLGLETFLGTSGRYFVRDMKASRLLQTWLARLGQRGVSFFYDDECENFSQMGEFQKISLDFSQSRGVQVDAACFCLGGGSYEPKEIPLRWPILFKNKGLELEVFTPSNVGYCVHWSPAFLKEAEGLPLKNIQFTSSRGTRKGDLVITRYGIEGTPVYFAGEVGEIEIDLKPDLSLEQILIKCRAVKENLSPIRRVSKQLNLCPAALALLFHMGDKAILKDLTLLAQTLKHFKVLLHGTQSLAESISSQGGLQFSELDSNFMLFKYPGIFAAGEMLNWDAPTGGFLIQACVSQGFAMGLGVLGYLKKISR